jgi:hypothetical protein
MISVPSELKDALKQSGSEPVRICDPATDEEFVVLRAEMYEHMRSLLCADHALTHDEQRRLLFQAGLRAGWDDPEMDVYNELVN